MKHIMSRMLAIATVVALITTSAATVMVDRLYVEYGENLGDTVPLRINYLLQQTGIEIITADGDGLFYTEEHRLKDQAACLILSLGNTTLSLQQLSITDVPAEGFRLLSKDDYTFSVSFQQQYQETENCMLIMSNGQPLRVDDGYTYSLEPDTVHYGAVVGSYAALESLGYAFLHPMQPMIPHAIQMAPQETVDGAAVGSYRRTPRAALALSALPFLDVKESPYWPKRTWHAHTQHPLEFTEVLNGFDIPMFRRSENMARPTSQYSESWESMFSTLDGYFEWLVANRQNRVEILLLGSEKWDKYGDLTSGPQRQQRLKKINELGHKFSILVGADLPIANRQQHGWKMINVQDPLEKLKQDIEDRIDWAFSADYDFISTESGLSEFTKPSCDLMLQLFNIFANYIRINWRREALTKVHCSTDQFCEETVPETGDYKYPDPRTGGPINFNFLPTYAMSGLGVMPHTVQVYSFDDPSANSYGNQNFTYMSDYMTYEAGLGQREVLYYGETAYWVNVDVDVPLFLPLHGQRRLYDLRRTARQEVRDGFRISGQANFESGWEFGYFISNAVTARAVWDPLMEVNDDWDAFEVILQKVLTDAAFTAPIAAELRSLIVHLSKVQAELLIYQSEKDLSKLSGHAYMSGSDTWVDLERSLGLAITQPDKIHLQETTDSEWEEMMQLLQKLRITFEEEADSFAILASRVAEYTDNQAIGNMRCSAEANRVIQELSDCVQILANRAKHNELLYQAQSLLNGTNPVIPDRNLGPMQTWKVTAENEEKRRQLLLDGRHLLLDTAGIMERRVNNFRVPVDRIAGWRQGPTVYHFGYVWAAASLYYFWRDQGVAEAQSLLAYASPCYLNRHEPLELAFGYGKLIEEGMRLKLKELGYQEESLSSRVAEMFADCLAPPLHEYQFPRDL